MMLKLLVITCLLAVCNARQIGHLIVGGEEAEVGQFPWQASLQTSSGGHLCGGTLIDSMWILTAARCVRGFPGNYQIVLGLHNRSSDTIGDPVVYPINLIVIHPDYIENPDLGYPNDVALLRLANSTNIWDNPFIDLIDMVSWEDDLEGEDGIISGWGSLEGFGEIPDNLQFAETEIISNSECANRTNPNWINDGHICVYTGDTGACSADTGGPLVINFGNDTYVAGIASWFVGSCDSGYPTAYTRVSYFYQWIINIIDFTV